LGAQALFGEKYGDEVRVVSMGRQDGSGRGTDGSTYSIELCGGTHVNGTGDIGLFVLLGDSASSAGVRRIEALTGEAALRHLGGHSKALAEVAGALKVRPDDAVARVQALMDERRALVQEVAQLRRDLAMSGGAGKGEAEIEEIGGTRLIAQVLTGVEGKDLPGLIDQMKAKIESGAVLLVADTGGKAAVAAGVTEDKAGDLSAIDMVRTAVAQLGGKGGGGRADLAQGGAASAENSAAAIDAVRALLKG
jgi:alanyl-tRNA synthetase